MQTQPISKVVQAAAVEALGGVPARPPQMQPLPLGGDAAAREAFQARHEAEQAAAAVPVFAPLGNTTFDPTPAELLARRAKVSLVRERLGNLARLIVAEEAGLGPILADLTDDAKVIKESEAFDTDAAKSFLTALGAVVAGLSAPAKPVKK